MHPDQTPNPPDGAGVVTWVHVGDLHMDTSNEQNYRDLHALVQKVNERFAEAASFVFLPGDNADGGSAAQYELVRSALDLLRVPWYAIVGDHDVHEKSFQNFLHFMSRATYFRFAVGGLVFLALNAFSTPDPKAFDVSDEQMDWLEEQLNSLAESGHAVLLLHCYPTDLKYGGERLRALIRGPRVLLIDMGHTHYNEVANDGATLYTATRSTGQIEEGPVGFSVINIDGDVVSWKFLPLTELSLVMITAPADERFLTTSVADAAGTGATTVRAKFWGDQKGVSLQARLGGRDLPMQHVNDSQVWQASFPDELAEGSHELVVTAQTGTGAAVEDRIRLRVGTPVSSQRREARDQDNALPLWPERGLLGTQLGPNKNGRKW